MRALLFSTSVFVFFLSYAGTASGLAAPNPAIKVMANGMILLKPVFLAEAKLQASLLGSKVDESAVGQELDWEIKTNPVLIYTYGLSPFSTEAIAILKSIGEPFTVIELGAEWFLLGGKESVKRVLLSRKVENEASSLPKVFIGGSCVGGCAELANLAESGELQTLVAKATAAPRRKDTPKKKSLFSFSAF